MPDSVTGRMEDLSSDYRDSAYAVIYYFNQVGTLVAFGLVSENLVIGVLGSWIMQMWRALEPVIIEERRNRIDTYPADTPANFSDYFEHLVQRVLEVGGREAMDVMQNQIGVKQEKQIRQGIDLLAPAGIGRHVTRPASILFCVSDEVASSSCCPGGLCTQVRSPKQPVGSGNCSRHIPLRLQLPAARTQAAGSLILFTDSPSP